MSNSLLDLAKKHYENFPVGSRLIPKKYRQPIHAIYAFARVADDIADEGSLTSEQRIAKLNEWEWFLLQSMEGKAPDSFFEILAGIIKEFNLPVQYFRDLITAFRKDAVTSTYATFEELLDYCRYSANPIGRLLLIIFHSSNPQNEKYSDYICTALQLTNFWQDISVDTRRNRFYIPTTDFEQFGITTSELFNGEKKNEFRQLMKFQVERTRTMFEQGKPLIHRVNKEFQKELAFIWLGGTSILDKIEALQYDTRVVRPSLSKLEMAMLALKALRQ